MSNATHIPQAVKKTLNQLGLRPSKLRGQNFLIDKTTLTNFLYAADLESGNTVLEVGPGLGVITNELVKRVKRVIAVEQDKTLAAYLSTQFRNFKNVQIINDDILKYWKTFQKNYKEEYKVVANLPYSITGRFLKIFLSEITVKPSTMVLLVQKEVAEKIIAPVGKQSKLSLLSQVYSEPKILFHISPRSFYPEPRVYSSAIKLVVKKKTPFVFPHEEKAFWQLIRIGFAARRKTLTNNFTAGLHIRTPEAKKLLKKANLKENVRAQELSIIQWLTLVDNYLKIH